MSNRLARGIAFGVVGGFLLVSALPGHAPGSRADEVGATVAVTPTQVVDGQAVAITIKSSARFLASDAKVALCRSGVTYQPSMSAELPNADSHANGPNCPGNPISSSADGPVLAPGGFSSAAATAAGARILYHVGAGAIDWVDSSTGASNSLTCGPTDPCTLLVEVLVVPTGAPGKWVPFAEPITYASDDPFGGCGGPADGVVTSGGSDRMSDSWVNWTIGECKLPGRTGAATRVSFVGEGAGMTSFASGSLDLAYSAGGYDPQMGLVPSDPPPRAAISIPIAMNAVVFAVGGGVRSGSALVPYHDIKLTQSEIAGFLTGGGTYGVPPYQNEIVDRNPSLGGDLFNVNVSVANGGPTAFAPSGAEATSWYMTRMLKTQVPAAWKVPDSTPSLLVPNWADKGKPRGIDSALALADPPFLPPPDQLALFTGRPAMRKALFSGGTQQGGGIWFLTDLATADALGLSPIAIESVPGSGDFVAPTPETVAAALPAMVPDAGGVLIASANPPAAAAGRPKPYALSMVEYAVAPAEPLLNSDCTRRDKSQALLAGWLKYITGAAGQATLPAGMIPLTPDLAATATAAIAKVGAAAVTGPCASASTPSTTTPPTTSRRVTVPPRSSGRNTGTSGGGNLGNVTGSVGSGGSAPAAGAGATTGTGTTLPATQPPAPTVVALPAFAGSRGTAYGGTIVAILGIIALSSLAAFAPSALGSRRRPGPGAGPP